MKKISYAIIVVLFSAALSFAAKQLGTSQTVTVNAPAEKVWAIIMDVNNWPKDNAAVQDAKLISGDGEVIGSVIEFVPVVDGKKTKATLTVAISEKNKKIEYNVKLIGGKAVMGFELSEKDGVTTLVNYERAEGTLVRFITQDGMDEEHRIWAESIKKRAESAAQ